MNEDNAMPQQTPITLSGEHPSSRSPQISALLHGALAIPLVSAMLAIQTANAGALLEQTYPEDTCGTTYIDKLSSCTPFRCTKPNALASLFLPPPDVEIDKLPPDQRKQAEQAMLMVEKKLEGMTPKKRALYKESLTAREEIKGRDAEGRCRTESQPNSLVLVRCAYDETMLKRLVDFSRMTQNAKEMNVRSSTRISNGKVTNQTTTTIDGKKVINPMDEAMNKGICVTYSKDPDHGWVSIKQLNHMGNIELRILEHGNPSSGRVRIINRENGKVVFDKLVHTEKRPREIHLQPGTYDVEVSHKDPGGKSIWIRDLSVRSTGLIRRQINLTP